MAEKHGETTHIKCSQCKCQYITLDEPIKNDFGYSGKQYKTCAKSRARKHEKNNHVSKQSLSH